MPGLCFLIFSVTFNTIQPDIVLEKNIQLHPNLHLILWYFSFLTNRVQRVKLNNTMSSPRITGVGVPQGSISSPVSFTSDCTSDCTTTVPNQFLLKYSDDSTLLTLFKRTGDPILCQSNVDWLVHWCDKNALIINIVKTEEVIFGKSSTCQLPKVKIHNAKISQVPAYKYLRVIIVANLSLTPHIEIILKKNTTAYLLSTQTKILCC